MIDRQCAHPIAIVSACKLHSGMAIANVSRSSPRQAQCELVLLEHGSVASEYLAIVPLLSIGKYACQASMFLQCEGPESLGASARGRIVD